MAEEVKLFFDFLRENPEMAVLLGSLGVIVVGAASYFSAIGEKTPEARTMKEKIGLILTGTGITMSGIALIIRGAKK